MSGDTLQAARTVSTSQYKCTGSAKLHQLKSVHKQSVKLPILFFKDFIQCHLCTTKTPRYYYISFVLFYKRTTWCTPILSAEGKNKAIQGECLREWSLFPRCLCRLWSQTPFIRRRLKKFPAHVHACPSVLFSNSEWVWWHAHAKSKKSNVLSCWKPCVVKRKLQTRVGSRFHWLRSVFPPRVVCGGHRWMSVDLSVKESLYFRLSCGFKKMFYDCSFKL